MVRGKIRREVLSCVVVAVACSSAAAYCKNPTLLLQRTLLHLHCRQTAALRGNVHLSGVPVEKSAISFDLFLNFPAIGIVGRKVSIYRPSYIFGYRIHDPDS